MFLKQGLTAVALLTFVLVKTSEGARACLATAVNNEDSNTKYTFALASLDDGDTETRIQEACYYGCGGQLMTKSPDRDSNGLTILDNSIHFLVSSGFLSSNETYIVNQLGVDDDEEGTGIGCIQFPDDTSYKRLPQSDPACKVAKIAICGFRDKQVIPSSTTPTEEIASSTTMASPETPTLSPKSTTTINMEDPVEATATVSSLLDNSAPTAAPSRLPSNAPSAHMFDVQGTSYKILTVEKKNATGLKALCKADKGMLGDISFASFQAFQKQMGKVNGVSKVVIGTWNGDMYSLQDNQCLFMTLNFGIVADDCANANAVLCQYNKN